MAERKNGEQTKQDLDNRSRQLDPEHDAYWRSRGEPERPADWCSRVPPAGRKQS